MRVCVWHLASYILLFCLGLLLIVQTGSCFADATNSYSITATIKPIVYIVVNQENVIQAIESNTNNVATKNVYRGGITGNKINMTKVIYRQYQLITDHGKLVHMGWVYTAPNKNRLMTKNLEQPNFISKITSQIITQQLFLFGPTNFFSFN